MRELVAGNEAHLPGREATVEHRVPDEDAAAGTDADRVGVRGAGLVMHLLDADGRVAGVLARLEPFNRGGKLRRADRVRSDSVRVRHRELLRNGENEQDGRRSNPPVARKTFREQ
jgi:hypothetical protein